LILRDCAQGYSGELGTPLDAQLDAPIVIRRGESQGRTFDAKRASSIFTPEQRWKLTATRNLVFCPCCRSRNRPAERFCHECGVEIHRPPERRRSRPAGTRPRPRRGVDRRHALIGLLVVLACAVPLLLLV
jgi:hypothetical protein